MRAVFVEAGRQAGYAVNADFNGASQKGVGTYQVTHKNGERFGAAKAYLTPNLQFHFAIAKLLDHGRATVLGHGYSWHVCLLRPVSRGSLTLGNKDPFAAPIINPRPVPCCLPRRLPR
ncbi:MAG: GMC family oxidoreductase N-terminal domain-containing protein [Burkholderiales bacterium]|nr:GMC family oxidoreductase N-terminal domain-containing protein [Burkholderiales bacterium]